VETNGEDEYSLDNTGNKQRQQLGLGEKRKRGSTLLRKLNVPGENWKGEIGRSAFSRKRKKDQVGNVMNLTNWGDDKGYLAEEAFRHS